MAIFKNISIKKRLIIVLLMWMILFVSYGGVTIKQINSLGSVTNFIYNNPLQVSNAATEIRVDIIKIQTAAKNLLLAESVAEQDDEMSKIRALDKAVLDNIEVISSQNTSQNLIELEQSIKGVFLDWQAEREKAINFFRTGHVQESTYVKESQRLVEELEERLKQVSVDSKETAYQLVKESKDVGIRHSFYLAVITIILSISFFIIFIATLKSIIDPINHLKQAMKKSINTGTVSLVNEEGDNEVIEMYRFYNGLAKRVIDVFWIKDNKNALNEKISGYYSQKEIAQKTINSLCRSVAAGKGAFYIYDKDSGLLKLTASYAYHELDQINTRFCLGEGIVGQVGLEKKAILLTDSISEESQRYTAIISKEGVNVYVFPIVYEDELYGVIEITALVPFEKLKLDYLEETSSLIARSVYSSQQSEELQQTNIQLEEQQQQLEEQTSILNGQNIKLEEAKRDLEISGKDKSDFLANMSHELRTPLNSIILLSKLILNNRKDALSIPNQEKIEVIHKSGEELLRLINDVLDLSKVESGTVSREDCLFHSSQIMQDIKGMFENTAKEKSLMFIVKDEVNQELYGDKHKISQILRNFISNAIKFTEKGLVKVELKHNPKLSNEVIFSVKDSGIGILEAQEDLIFEQFQQGDSSISRKYGGTGLGLSISKKLAEVLGGYIKVKSKSGEGSEFILYVPNLIRSKSAISLTAENKKESLDAEGIQYSENLIGAENGILGIEEDGKALNLTDKKILIIGDDPRNVYNLASILEDHNACVLEAHNGRAALKKLDKEKVDLIIVDIIMPEIDGYEAIKQIRKDNRYINIPIIVITSKALIGDRDRFVDVGANDSIVKPIDYRGFINVIGEWVA